MSNYSKELIIDDFIINDSSQTYFIADIAANHDSDLSRAKELIHMCAEAGANAAKFQHFSADTIVSDFGFKSLGKQISHQSSWNKSVYQIYKDASLNLEWTEILAAECKKAGITFFTSPYSIEIIEIVDKFIPAYKIGSGDITWHEIVLHIAKKNKPYFIAAGASNMNEVIDIVDKCSEVNNKLCLMQCNTNYTASLENFKYINLNVLNTFKKTFPGLILGLSDHTPGHSTVLGAISLGAKLIEKHFTDDNKREGPDHKFSMNPASWRDMVDRARELELALGDGIKRIENNELETTILQRRSIRAKRNIKKGENITENDIVYLRPCTNQGIPPYKYDKIVNHKVKDDIKAGEEITWQMIK